MQAYVSTRNYMLAKMGYTMSLHFHIIALHYIVTIAQYYNIIVSSCFHIVILLIGKQEAYHICLLLMIQLLSMTSAHTHICHGLGGSHQSISSSLELRLYPALARLKR